MVSLGALLDPGFRQPASCLIEVGEDFADIGIIADLVTAGRDHHEPRRGGDRHDHHRGPAQGGRPVDRRRFRPLHPLGADQGLRRLPDPCRGGLPRLHRAAQAVLPQLRRRDEARTAPCRTRARRSTASRCARSGARTAPMSDRDILDRAGRAARPSPSTVTPATANRAARCRRTRRRSSSCASGRKANGYDLIFAEGKVYFGPKRLDGETAGADHGLCRPRHELPEPRDRRRRAASRRGALRSRAAGGRRRTGHGDGHAGPDPRSARRRSPRKAPRSARRRCGASRSEGDETEEEVRARAQALVNEHAFRIRANGRARRLALRPCPEGRPHRHGRRHRRALWRRLLRRQGRAPLRSAGLPPAVRVDAQRDRRGSRPARRAVERRLRHRIASSEARRMDDVTPSRRQSGSSRTGTTASTAPSSPTMSTRRNSAAASW